MLDTATAIVAEHGLSIGFDHLHFDDLIKAADVSRTSVYRRWPTKEDFFAEFLASIAKPEGEVGSAYSKRTQQVGREVFEANLGRLTTREGRIAVVREAIRLAVDQNYLEIVEDPSWRAYTALLATARNSPDPTIREAVLEALREADKQFIDAMATFYDQMLPVAKARFRDGVTSHHFAAAGASVVEGLGSRRIVNEALADSKVPGPSIDSGTIRWSLASAAFLGITLQLVDFLTDEEWDAYTTQRSSAS